MLLSIVAASPQKATLVKIIFNVFMHVQVHDNLKYFSTYFLDSRGARQKLLSGFFPLREKFR